MPTAFVLINTEIGSESDVSKKLRALRKLQLSMESTILLQESKPTPWIDSRK
jgi:hypothetical protein